MTTDISVVLDRSGSMETCAADTIGGFNKFLCDQQGVPGACTLTLVQFDNYYEVVYDAVPLASVKQLTSATFVPRGSTALLDAMGRCITDTGARLKAMPEASRPARVIVVIVTDGYENASQKFSRKEVFDLMAQQRDIYQWDFLYLGANQDAIGVAADLGMPATAALNYVASAQGMSNAYRAMSRAVAGQRVNSTAKVAFTQAERDDAVSE